MRAIDADELANRLIALPKRKNSLADEVILNTMLWHIDQEPSIAARWTPCTDRLPEMPGEYLVEYVAEDMTFHRVLYYWINDKVWGTGWHDMGNPLDTFTDHTVDMVAWMPLPGQYNTVWIG